MKKSRRVEVEVAKRFSPARFETSRKEQSQLGRSDILTNRNMISVLCSAII